MAKKIIFCADGTWNGPEKETRVSAIDDNDEHGELPKSKVTNVVKLFRNLPGQVTPETRELTNEHEKVSSAADGSIAQIAKYLHGVGDAAPLLFKLPAGVLGVGVIGRIVRGYTFISRHYAAGDEIHIAGFSRGAYTARALAGMIARVGLLDPRSYDPKDKREAYRLGFAAWCKSKSVSLQGGHKLTDLSARLLNAAQEVFARQLSDDDLIADVGIKSVAVWDTVGSLGIPVYAADGRYDILRFSDNALSPRIEHGFHAMAIDELRVDFPVTRWDEREGVQQVWFAGAHCDVGGGYDPAECGLSDIALDWMMQRLAGAGVSFAAPLVYKPSLERMDQAIHEPWKNPPFHVLLKVARKVLPGDAVHDSVLQRWRSKPAYRPASLAAWAAQQNLA